MNKITIPSSILSLLFVFSPALSPVVVAQDAAVTGVTQNDQILPYYKLPQDAKTPTITLNYRGGFTPPKISDEPTMSIFPDGTIIMPKKFEHTKEYKGKLTESEVQDLLHFIIGTNEFFKYDQEAVKEKIVEEKQRIKKAGGGIMRLADAATLEIKVTANGKTNQASHYPSGVDESKIPELVHVAAIRRRLQQVMAQLKIGGKEVVEKWLKKANTALLAKHPKASPLTMEDFQSGTERNDGSVFVSFLHLEMDGNNKPIPNNLIAVNINQPASGKGEARINVTVRRPK